MNFEIAPKTTEIQANWDDAKLYCFFLNIDGKTGWRLPTYKELEEISQSENDFALWYHWSADEAGINENNEACAWPFNFEFGTKYGMRKIRMRKIRKSHYVRAVRDL
jgi:hypothetical protein